MTGKHQRRNRAALDAHLAHVAIGIAERTSTGAEVRLEAVRLAREIVADNPDVLAAVRSDRKLARLVQESVRQELERDRQLKR